MRYLITGGAGFIGTHLAAHLLSRGDQVTVLDIRVPAYPVPGVSYVHGSVADERLLKPAVARHDGVFHLAAIVGFAHVMRATVTTVLTSTFGGGSVFWFCADQGRRVLFTSTSACYGRATSGAAVKETDDAVLGPPRTASWSYAYAKATEEALAFAYHRERALPVIVTRLFNTVGPYQSAEAGFVLPRFVAQAVHGKPLTVYAPGTQTRTFGHVQDVVRGLASLMECDRAVGELVNLGGTETVSMRALAEQVVASAESRSVVTLVEQPYGPGYDNVDDRRPDLTKAGELIRYRPRYGLADMIDDVIQSQRERAVA